MRYLEIEGVPRLSKIGLGTWQFGSREWGYGPDYADREAGAIVRRALDLGVNLIDTAEIYGFGRSERIIGRALDGRRDDAFLATKVFPVAPLPAVVEQRGTASARRLGVRRLDLYQVHWPNPLVTDAPVMGGMKRLRDLGVVDEVGVSNYPLRRWQRAEEALGSRVLSNQVQYNLVVRGPDFDLVPWARDHARVVIASSPLAQGVLAGTYSPDHRPGGIRRRNPMFLPDNLRRMQPLLDVLRQVAETHDATPAQAALAWTLREPNVVAIPGASSIAQLESNVAAAELVLAADEIDALDAAAAAFRPLQGTDAYQQMGRDLIDRVRGR
ncbi:MAG: aldo/keto reductase [Egibacteraceae bacterium]